MGQCPMDMAFENEYTICIRGNVYAEGISYAAGLPAMTRLMTATSRVPGG